MSLRTRSAAALIAAFALGGCSSLDEAFFPESGDMAGTSPDQSAAVTTADAGYQAPATPRSSTGTLVGQKVNSLRGDLGQLQSMLRQHNQSLQGIRGETVQDSQRYHGTVAAINARLQVGTTPGNPVLNQQWNSAQSELDRIGEDVLKMTRLANEITASSALAGYLLESVRAARQLSGAVDEDHRQLRILEDETNRTVVLVERLLNELSTDISRQQTYISTERQNLNTLAVAIKNGQLYGSSLGGSASGLPFVDAPTPQAAPRPVVMGASGPSLAERMMANKPSPSVGMSGMGAGGDNALVTIRFDRAGVNYESALYTAVKSALDRRPGSSFEVVAVAPPGATPGSQSLVAGTVRRNAEMVARSLGSMGLPSDRIRITQAIEAGAAGNEVKVFVR